MKNLSNVKTKMIDNGSLPFGHGLLQIRLIESADGDVRDDDGSILTYAPDGTLTRNYILVYVTDDEEKITPITNSSDLQKIFGILEKRADAIIDYISDKMSSELPMLPAFDDSKTFLVFSNLSDVYLDVYGADSEEYKSIVKQGYDKLSEQHVPARNLLAKFANMLEKGFNEAHYETVADRIVEEIGKARFLTSSGEIHKLNISALEHMFEMIKQKIYID